MTNIFSQKYVLFAVVPFVLASFVVAITPESASADVLPQGITSVETCGSVSVPIRSFGAGLMYQTSPIEPVGVQMSAFSTAEHCAVVSWSTPIVATSQVVFAELGSQPASTDASIKPNFGYPQGTPQNNSGEGFHQAVLKNLEPGKTYAYRVITRSHPTAMPYISAEMTFTMPMVQSMVPAPVTYTPTTVVYTPSVPKATVPVVAPKSEVATTEQVTPSVSPSEVATETPDIVQPEPISAIIAAGSAVESAGGSFWDRFVRAFSFLLPKKAEAPVVNNSLDVAPRNIENSTLSLSGLFARDKYIIPSLFFLVLLFLLQQLLLPAIGVKVTRPLVFWMFGVIALAVFAGIFGLYYVALIMLATFLALLAWYVVAEFGDKPIGTRSLDKPSEKAVTLTEKTG